MLSFSTLNISLMLFLRAVFLACLVYISSVVSQFTPGTLVALTTDTVTNNGTTTVSAAYVSSFSFNTGANVSSAPIQPFWFGNNRVIDPNSFVVSDPFLYQGETAVSFVLSTLNRRPAQAFFIYTLTTNGQPSVPTQAFTCRIADGVDPGFSPLSEIHYIASSGLFVGTSIDRDPKRFRLLTLTVVNDTHGQRCNFGPQNFTQAHTIPPWANSRGTVHPASSILAYPGNSSISQSFDFLSFYDLSGLKLDGTGDILPLASIPFNATFTDFFQGVTYLQVDYDPRPEGETAFIVSAVSNQQSAMFVVDAKAGTFDAVYTYTSSNLYEPSFPLAVINVDDELVVVSATDDTPSTSSPATPAYSLSGAAFRQPSAGHFVAYF